MRLRKVFTEKKISDIVERGMEKSALDKATDEGMPEPAEEDRDDDLRPEYDFSKGVRGKYYGVIYKLFDKKGKK